MKLPLIALSLLLTHPLFASESVQRQLNEAAHKGDLEQMRQLLDAGARVNGTESGTTWTALCSAVDGGQLEAAKLLYERRGDLQVVCYQGTLLNKAFGRGQADLARWMLSTGQWSQKDLQDAWYYADRPEILQLLLDAGIPVDYTDRQESKLFSAAWSGNLELVKFLVSKGADPDFKSFHGVTPLMRAVGDGRGEDRSALVDFLISTGRVDVNAVSTEGGSVLSYAARHGNLKAVERLLAANAQVDLPHPESGRTPLMSAGSAEVAEALLAHGADPNAVDKRGLTALMLAWAGDYDRKDNLLIASALLDHRADPDLKDRALGFTALHYAAYHGDMAGVALLAQHVATIDEPSLPVIDAQRNIVGGGQTPLMLAALEQKKDIVMYLLLAGANPRATDAVGHSVLNYAGRDAAITVGGREIYKDFPRVDPDTARLIERPPRLPAKKASLDPSATHAALRAASAVRW